MKKEIIKTWLKDHDIKIDEERIDILITMLKSEPKEEFLEVNPDIDDVTCEHTQGWVVVTTQQ